MIETVNMPEKWRKRIEEKGRNLLGDLFEATEDVGNTHNLSYQNKRIFLDELFIWLISKLTSHHVTVLSEMLKEPMVGG